MQTFKEEEQQLHKEDPDKVNNYIISKFLRTGFDSLNTEELAYALINPNFNENFNQKTGYDFNVKYQIKAIDKLRKQKIDMNFLTVSIQSTDEYAPFFSACILNKLEILQEFFKKYDSNTLIKLYDSSGNSPLHYCVKSGNFAVTEYLLFQGFNPEQRDRLFRSSLHLACLYGHGMIADLIIKHNRISFESKDLRGRSAIHFASCSPSSDCLSILLLYDKEIVKERDNFLRTPLHYSVLNSSPDSLDITRLLIQNGAEINSVDDDGKTIGHYASESGKIKSLPFLIQKGLDLGIKEKNKNKTAIELAANDQVRDNILLYSTTPFAPINLEDQRFLAKGLIGTKANIYKDQIVDIKDQNLKNGFKLKNNYISSEKENQKQKLVQSSIVAEFLQNNFVDILRKLQEHGIKSNQHAKRAYLFTGSWFEGITSVEALYERIKDLTPQEAMLRTYNILMPFNKEMPMKNANENFYSDNFYGSYFNYDEFKPDKGKQINNDIMPESQKLAYDSIIKRKEFEFQAMKDELNSLKTELEKKQLQQNIEIKQAKTNTDLEKDQEKKNEKLKSENKILVEKFQIFEKEIKGLQNSLKYQDQLKQENVNFKTKFEVLENEIQNFTNLSKENQNQLDSKNKRINNLESTIETLNKNIEDLTSNLQKQKIENQTIVKIKTIEEREKEKRNFNIKNVSIEDEIAFSKLLQNIKTTNQSIEQLLKDEDKDLDQKLTKLEFSTFLNKYLNNESRVITLLKFFDLNGKYNDLYIKDFLEFIERRGQLFEKSGSDAIKKLILVFEQNNINVNKIENCLNFKNCDLNKDQNINMSEFKALVNSVKISVNFTDNEIERLFVILDEDDSGTISIKEFSNALKSQKAVDDLQQGKKIIDPNAESKNQNGTIKQTAKITIKEKDEEAEIDQLPGNTEIKGEIKIQCSDLKFDKIAPTTLKIRLPGINKNYIEKQIQNVSDFKYACRIPIGPIMLSNISKKIEFLFQNTKTNFEQKQISWVKCFQNPDKWQVNQQFDFEKGIQMIIQMKFIQVEEKQQEKPIVPIQNKIQLQKTFKNENAFKGHLELSFVDLINFPVEYLKQFDKLYLEILLPNNEKKKAKFIVSNEKMILNSNYSIPFDVKKDQMVQCLYIKLLEKKGLFGENLKGDFYIDFSEAINFPGQQLQNSFYNIFSDNKQSLMQIQAITRCVLLNDKNSSNIFEGTLKLKLKRAKNILPEETDFFKKKPKIDPFFKFYININQKEKLEFKSQVVKDNTNPNYDESFNFPLRLIEGKNAVTNEINLPDLKIELWDKEVFKDTLQADSFVNWQECFKDPGKWKINQYIPLKNQKGLNDGEVYLCLNYIPKGFLDDNNEAQDIDNVIQNKQIVKSIEGNFDLRIIFACGLKYISLDTMVWQKNVQISPYVEIQFPNDEKQKTNNIQKKKNNIEEDVYIFNEQFQQKFSFKDSTKINSLKLIIKNKTGIFSSDKIISSLNIPIDECLESPNVWAINNIYYLLHDFEVLKKLQINDVGQLYIQCKFNPKDSIDDKSEPKVLSQFDHLLGYEKPVKGCLSFIVIHCKDLPVCDSGLNGSLSDPFVTLTLLPKKTILKTKVIKNTLNPIFEETLTFDINLLEKEIKDLKIKIDIYDKDLMDSDDFMGNFIIENIENLFYESNHYVINNIYDIKMAENLEKKNKDKIKPQIYLQGKFLYEEEKDCAIKPPFLEDLRETLKNKK